jgi:hypothetical protein
MTEGGKWERSCLWERGVFGNDWVKSVIRLAIVMNYNSVDIGVFSKCTTPSIYSSVSNLTKPIPVVRTCAGPLLQANCPLSALLIGVIKRDVYADF